MYTENIKDPYRCLVPIRIPFQNFSVTKLDLNDALDLKPFCGYAGLHRLWNFDEVAKICQVGSKCLIQSWNLNKNSRVRPCAHQSILIKQHCFHRVSGCATVWCRTTVSEIPKKSKDCSSLTTMIFLLWPSWIFSKVICLA